MAQAVAKAAGPAAPQEDAPLKPTKYTLEDFAPGQHVTAKTPTVQGQSGTAEAPGGTYTGTIERVNDKGMAAGTLTVRLDQEAPGGQGEILVFPHEITAIDEPEAPEKESSTKSGTSNVTGGAKKESEDKYANRPQVGENVHVEVGGHDYGGVVVTEVYGDGSTGPTGPRTARNTRGSSGGST